MSTMRLTMIVHSVDGDDQGGQEAIMVVRRLPDIITPDQARRFLGALANNIDDEWNFVQAEDEENAERERRISEKQVEICADDTTYDNPACVCDSNAEEDIDDDCPVHGREEAARQLRKEGTGGGEPGIPVAGGE